MEKQVIARSSRILLRRTGEADLDFVLWAENHEDNTPFVGQWTGNEHRRAFMDDNMEHLIIETFPAGQRIGYVIMRGLGENHRSIELKRIVITEKNQGYGRETLRMVKKLCFE
jgi:diamine N-acetyltransferase